MDSLFELITIFPDFISIILVLIIHGRCSIKSVSVKKSVKSCCSHYEGQTKCWVEKRVIQHNLSDINSHLVKHANEMGHERVWLEDFKVLGSGYSNDFKRKVSESLFINELKPDLNVQKTAFKLPLFNWLMSINWRQYIVVSNRLASFV